SDLLYFGGSALDLDGNARNVDLPDVPNRYGPMDLGAYEVQTDDACANPDTVFCDGFDGWLAPVDRLELQKQASTHLTNAVRVRRRRHSLSSRSSGRSVANDAASMAGAS